MLESLGVGYTVIVKVFGGPAQSSPELLNVGVTSIVADIGVVPGLVAVNDIFVEPFAPSPIPVLSFVQ